MNDRNYLDIIQLNQESSRPVTSNINKFLDAFFGSDEFKEGLEEFRKSENKGKNIENLANLEDFIRSDPKIDPDKVAVQRFLGDKAGNMCLFAFSRGHMALRFNGSLDQYSTPTRENVYEYFLFVNQKNEILESESRDIEDRQTLLKELDQKRISLHSKAANALWSDILKYMKEHDIIQFFENEEAPRAPNGLCRGLVSLMLEAELGITKS